MINIDFRFQQNLFEDSFKIRETVFIKEQGFRDEFEEKDKTCYHLVLYYNNLPIGNARIEITDKDTCYLGRFAILKEYRNKGYGTILIKEAENKIKSFNISTIYLNAQYDKAGFYTKLGYKRTYKQPFYDEKYLHYEMYKIL